jgi:hypothetical protein
VRGVLNDEFNSDHSLVCLPGSPEGFAYMLAQHREAGARTLAKTHPLCRSAGGCAANSVYNSYTEVT